MTDNYNMQVIETALRILYILDTLEQAMSFDKILYVDFMISYLNDFDVTQKNLLPPSPFRKEELYIRNKVILNAINYLLIRKLIDILLKKTEYIIFQTTTQRCLQI